MNARRGLLVVLILATLVAVGLAVSARAQVSIEIQCTNGVCLVPWPVLQLLMRQATEKRNCGGQRT
ncbi:MAG TPA: hypothetical protein VFV90_10875 [Usitatibacter sp.]|nr:hypothetical protein [Usitatibacter sp.]